MFPTIVGLVIILSLTIVPGAILSVTFKHVIPDGAIPSRNSVGIPSKRPYIYIGLLPSLVLVFALPVTHVTHKLMDWQENFMLPMILLFGIVTNTLLATEGLHQGLAEHYLRCSKSARSRAGTGAHDRSHINRIRLELFLANLIASPVTAGLVYLSMLATRHI